MSNNNYKSYNKRIDFAQQKNNQDSKKTEKGVVTPVPSYKPGKADKPSKLDNKPMPKPKK